MMKSAMTGSLIWYVLGVLTATVPCSFYVTATDHYPVFVPIDSPLPDFWTTFWNNFSRDFIGTVETTFLVIFITTPLYFLLRFLFRLRCCSIIYIFTMAWLAGGINFCLVLFVLTTTGQAVRGPPGLMDRFMESGGIFALPFISTAIAFLPGFLFSPFFRKRIIS